MTIQPTNPFHISRAYGVEHAGLRARAPGGVPRQGVEGAASGRPTGEADGVSGPVLGRVIARSSAEASGPLVGARIPGRIDFSGESPRQIRGTVQEAVSLAKGGDLNAQGAGPAQIDRAYSGVTGAGAGSYAMYRRPTDKNEAAVAVAVGRSLDTTA